MIAAYIRVSSDKQDVARQRESIAKWAERNGHAIGHWFADAEGKNPRDKASKRVEFQKLLKAVESGLVEKIIVDSQDRFGTRDAYEFGKFLTVLRENDCELWSVNQGLLSAADDATILTNTIGALTSTREQKEKATRNLSGKIQKAKAGEYQGGYAPFGCDVVCFAGDVEKWRVQWVGKFERWKIYPDGTREAYNGKDNFPSKDPTDTLRYRPTTDAKRLTVIRDVFKWFATEDISTGGIADRLNSMGITTTVGSPWYKVLVKQTLTNPAYIGRPAWNKRGSGRFKEYTNGDIRDVEGKVTGRKRDEADYLQPDKPEFKPMVPRATWDKVQAKLAASRRPAHRAPQVANLWLKPYLVCGGCGKPMRACSPTGRMTYGSYICGNYGKYGKNNPSGCRCHRVKHDVLEGVVSKYLEENAPKVAELVAAADEGDSELFECLYEDWGKAVTEQNRLWLEMAKKAGSGYYPWEIDKPYRQALQQSAPEIQAAIAEKESQLDAMLDGFASLSPRMKDRANQKMEALDAEIDALRAELTDLARPWLEASAEARQRMEAMGYAVDTLHRDGAYRERSEALRRVVERIVCHFRYQGVKSIIDAVEIVPISPENVCFTNGVTLGQD